MATIQEMLEKGQEEIMKALEGISDMDAESMHVTMDWAVRDIIGNLTAYEHVLDDVFGDRLVVHNPIPFLSQLKRMGSVEFDKFHFEEYRYLPYSEVLSQLISRHQHIISMVPKQMTTDLLEEKGVVPWFDQNASIADYVKDRHLPRKLEMAQKIWEFKRHNEITKHNPSKKSDL